MSRNSKTRIKIPHTKWSLAVNDVIIWSLALFVPTICSLLLVSIFGAEVLYLISLVILSYILVTGIDIVNDDENKKDDH